MSKYSVSISLDIKINLFEFLQPKIFLDIFELLEGFNAKYFRLFLLQEFASIFHEKNHQTIFMQIKAKLLNNYALDSLMHICLQI
jgi:hypothetical protein